MGCLSIIFTLGAVVTEYGMNPSKIDRDSLQNMLSGLEALLAFFAGLYVQQVLDRYHFQRHFFLSSCYEFLISITFSCSRRPPKSLVLLQNVGHITMNFFLENSPLQK